MMRPTDNTQALRLLALGGLALASHRLSARFYTSAAFEHPILLSIAVLLISSAALRLRPACTEHHRRDRPLAALRPATHPTKGTGVISSIIDASKRTAPRFRTLVACLVLRTLLFWHTLRAAQCSWRGVEAFVLVLIPLAERLVAGYTGRLPESRPHAPESGRWGSRVPFSTLGYGLLAVAWAASVMIAIRSSVVSTGAVCPAAWPLWSFTPLLQVAMCGLDAIIVAQFFAIRRLEVDEGHDASAFTSKALAAAALFISAIAFFPILIELRTIYLLRLNYVDVRDLLLDSCIAAVVVVCGFEMLDVLQPWTLAFIVVGLGLVGFRIPTLGASPLPAPLTRAGLLKSACALVAVSGPLVYRMTTPDGAPRGSTPTLAHRWIKFSLLALAVLFAGTTLLLPAQSASPTLPDAVNGLFRDSELQASRWEQDAAQSWNLDDAVRRYKRRYGIPPPPNFDEWYEFARAHGSPVIDSFDQIHQDLLPFWGIDPSEIRSRAAHALEYPGLDLGSLRIRDGRVEQSPDIPGTHRWMAESIDGLIRPFSQHLPDMDLVFNLGDECRVAVPYADKQDLLIRANEARTSMAEKYSQGDNVPETWSSGVAWPSDWATTGRDPDEISPQFSSNLRKQLYYEWIAPTCAPGSTARRSRWWDRSTCCVACAEPHSVATDEGAVMADFSKADDVCYQPDLAHLDGFILSPTSASTKVLFPIFSQSRVGGFSDILFPSPWNFNLKSEYEPSEDLSWDDKINALFWRGSPSDGYAWGGTWTGFARARLVNEGYRLATSSATGHLPGVNVSFAGDVSKCHEADCLAEMAEFTRWSRAAVPEGDAAGPDAGPLPRPTPFDEHWHFRHLMDMDGAGFSGRFIPFLQSRSLVYRSAVFRTWFDERLRGWQHFVPVDVRLGRGFWSVVRYLAGDGDEIARQISQRGRDWAARALRPEDMQVYMFRLLLEWGRVVDDDRGNLGFDVA